MHVSMPSRMKIQRQPFRPPTPLIWAIPFSNGECLDILNFHDLEIAYKGKNTTKCTGEGCSTEKQGDPIVLLTAPVPHRKVEYDA